MGVVYRAEQISRKRIVALKVLSKTLATSPGFQERFRREARAMGRLDHPNIVRYFAAGEAGGFVYLAMELVEAGSLAKWLGKLGKLPVPDAVFVAAECGKGLQYAHEQGLVHRDVKPDNVLLSPDGRVKLADLGLAKAADDDTGLTQTGIGIGTPLYAAPEQTRNAKHADARSDLYALGSVAYHCLTGRPPFPGSNLLEILTAKEKGVYVPPSVANPAVPASLDRVLVRLLAKKPEHRYQSCAEFLEELGLLGLAGSGVGFLT
jgi:serine/threonine-protein kinase